MSNRGTKRKNVADEGVSAETGPKEQRTRDQSELLYCRPGPASSKRAFYDRHNRSHLCRSTTPVPESAVSERAYSLPASGESCPEPEGVFSPESSREETLLQRQRISQERESESESLERNATNQPLRSSSRLGRASPIIYRSSRSSAPSASQHQPKSSPQNSKNVSKTESEDRTAKFIQLMRELPSLYDRTDPTYKDKQIKADSWIALSKELGMTVNGCITRWKSLREKYCHEKKRLADKLYVSEKNMQFLKDMNFLYAHQKKATYKPRRLTGNGPVKRTQSKSTPRSARQATPSHLMSPAQSEMRTESSRLDLEFAKDIALALQDCSIQQKAVIKAKFWQIVAEFVKPA